MTDDNWIDQYCLTKKGAATDFKQEWGADRFLIGGKMFGMKGHNNHKRPLITLKCPPDRGQSLRDEYKDKIIPGYYMNKLHWNSVFLETDVPQWVIKQMIDESYQLIFAGLTKKVQAYIADSKNLTKYPYDAP